MTISKKLDRYKSEGSVSVVAKPINRRVNALLLLFWAGRLCRGFELAAVARPEWIRSDRCGRCRHSLGAEPKRQVATRPAGSWQLDTGRVGRSRLCDTTAFAIE